MKKWWIIGAVVAAALVLLGGALLTSQGSLGGKGPAAADSVNSAGQGAAPTQPPVVVEEAPKPVDKPVKLPPITKPPVATLAMIDAQAATAGSSYTITFVPYGPGPEGPGASLVASIRTSKPGGGVAKAFPFAGRNVLLDVRKLPVKQAVKVGGSYSGVLVLTPENGLLVPQLVSAHKI